MTVLACPHCSLQFDMKLDTRLDWARHVKYCERGPNARKHGQPPGTDESLDCYWCGKLFKNFKTLALHVQAHGAPNFEEAVRYYLEEQKKEDIQMSLPAPTASANGTSNPFIKSEHFNGKEKGTLVLLGGRIPQGTNAYSDIYIDVKLGKDSYTWGLKADSRNYAALFKRFGADEKKWKGSVDVVIAKGKYINVAGS